MVFATLICLPACLSQNGSNWQDDQTGSLLADVRQTVLALDSAVVGEHRQTPDSIERMAKSKAVEIFMEISQDDPDNTEPVRVEQAYQEASRAWERFKRLCLEGNYEQALDFYLATDEDSVKTHAGDLLIHLNKSKQRYILMTRVVAPLMRTYRGDSLAIVQLIEDLSLEKLFEDLTMEMNEDYVPEVYPAVVRGLGMAMTMNGQIDEALGLANDLVYAVFRETRNVLAANVRTVQYRVELLQLVGDDESILGEYQWIRSFLLENEEVYDAEELKMAIQQIDSEIEQLQCKLKN